MPFIRFENPSFDQSHTIDPEELPIFLIPGILGNSAELFSLAEAINKQRGGRTPIYIYEEPTINGKPEELTLLERAISIAKEILEKRRFSPLPYIITGYSFGGILGSLVSLILQHIERTTHLCVLDEPCLPFVNSHLAQNQDKLTMDLLSIVNYAMKLADPEFDALELSDPHTLSKMELEDRFQYLADSIVSKQESISSSVESMFYTYCEIAKLNLRSLINPGTGVQQKLDNVHFFFTDATVAKYGDENLQFTGGWENISRRTTNLNEIASSELGKQSHLDLLTKTNAESVARMLIASLNKEITKEQLKALHDAELDSSEQDKQRKRTLITNLFNPEQAQRRSSFQYFNFFNKASTPFSTEIQPLMNIPKQHKQTILQDPDYDLKRAIKVV